MRLWQWIRKRRDENDTKSDLHPPTPPRFRPGHHGSDPAIPSHNGTGIFTAVADMTVVVLPACTIQMRRERSSSCGCEEGEAFFSWASISFASFASSRDTAEKIPLPNLAQRPGVRLSAVSIDPHSVLR